MKRIGWRILLFVISIVLFTLPFGYSQTKGPQKELR